MLANSGLSEGERLCERAGTCIPGHLSDYYPSQTEAGDSFNTSEREGDGRIEGSACRDRVSRCNPRFVSLDKAPVILRRHRVSEKLNHPRGERYDPEEHTGNNEEGHAKAEGLVAGSTTHESIFARLAMKGTLWLSLIRRRHQSSSGVSSPGE